MDSSKFNFLNCNAAAIQLCADYGGTVSPIHNITLPIAQFPHSPSHSSQTIAGRCTSAVTRSRPTPATSATAPTPASLRLFRAAQRNPTASPSSYRPGQHQLHRRSAPHLRPSGAARSSSSCPGPSSACSSPPTRAWPSSPSRCGTRLARWGHPMST
jgi:hypothetical protein